MKRPAPKSQDQSDSSLLAQRLQAQRLSGAPADGPLELTRHLLAVQAQDPRAARLTIRVRTEGGHASDVDRALTDERSMVITWANRGTLHLIAVEDEPWLHVLTTPQLRTSNERRLQQEGVSPANVERGIATLVRALADGPMTRTQIRDALDHADVPTARQALVHILVRATLDGLIVRGPIVNGEHAFVLVSDWLGPRPKVNRDQALAELARRYLAGHGPADDRDLAKWAQITLRDARAALSAITSEVTERPDGLLSLSRDQEPWPLPPPLLLGPFDPLLLGWHSRDLVVANAEKVVTTNGIIRAIALVEGRAAGIWTFAAGRVQLDLWGNPDPATVQALSDEATAVEAYVAERPNSSRNSARRQPVRRRHAQPP